MIGRDPLSATTVAAGVLTFGLFMPFGLIGPAAARAEHLVGSLATGTAVQERAPVHVTLRSSGVDVSFETRATSVADFLNERDISPAADDYVSADPSAPLAEGMTLEYRPSVPVTLTVGDEQRFVRTTAANVRDLLLSERVALGKHDTLTPSAFSPLHAGDTIRIVRVSSWTQRVRQSIAQSIEHQLDFHLAPGVTRVVSSGTAGIKEFTYRFVQRDRNVPQRSIIASRIVRAPSAKVVAHGVGEYAAFAQFAIRGFAGTMRIAGSALTMIATAYTANCYGCSGIAANGSRAGHGIVAVDPHVIPLGTHLFIPGYGHALAGDTGGAIVGNRIDLGFESNGDALRFGRRPITVYVLR